jgi:hypothetical protein
VNEAINVRKNYGVISCDRTGLPGRVLKDAAVCEYNGLISF